MTTIAIDGVLHDTWRTVCQLRNGWQAEDGRGLYRTACSQVDEARAALTDAGLSAADIDHILYAQCALLDGAVMSRKVQDASYREWLNSPLQTRYFNTLGAGELLWERIRGVLRQPAPNVAVLTCFHRVLLLGFSGQYRDEDAPDREAMLATLERLVPPFTLPQPTPMVVKPRGRRYRRGARSLWWRALLAVVALAGLWWGLHLSLQQWVQQTLS
ncbi:conserved hypothetical protein [Enterobacterales bacterium 8AC]|jgi:type VI secretion system protein ImpK|nr:conserved hypothetical protein [Enterobacterales bacterium 8AC]